MLLILFEHICFNIEKFETIVERNPFETNVFEQDKKQQLTQDQQVAYDAISKTIESGTQRTLLKYLHLISKIPSLQYLLVVRYVDVHLQDKRIVHIVS